MVVAGQIYEFWEGGFSINRYLAIYCLRKFALYYYSHRDVSFFYTEYLGQPYHVWICYDSLNPEKVVWGKIS